MILDNDDKIIACSTSESSNAAISIIRLSGFNDLDFLKNCISIDPKNIKVRYSHFCSLYNGEQKIDELVLTFFAGPNSYNGENILELGVHGNILNVNRIIDFFTSKKEFRRAYPGEFTYRALRNKKLSLSEVEGLDLLLNANSNYALDQGNSLLSGELKESYSELYKSFLKHKSSLELSIDFLDDIGEEESHRQLKDSFASFSKVLSSLVSRTKANVNNLLRPDICLLGKPNSGKSSLFNSLLESDRAIVSDIEGTTRDFIRENININNSIFSLIDTAGVRNTTDKIEEIGINKALNIFENSFYKILLIDPQNFSLDEELITDKSIDLFLITHADLMREEELKSFVNGLSKRLNISNGPIETEKTGSIGPKSNGPIGAEKTGSIGPKSNGPIGAEKIGSIGPAILSLNSKNLKASRRDDIFSLVNSKYLSLVESQPISVSRHREVLLKIDTLSREYAILLNSEEDISIISSELNIVGHCISELIGIIRPEEVLNNIFDNFCIGK